MTKIKNGTVKPAAEVDLSDDIFGRTAETDGFYIYFGMWKGPFATKAEAKEAYREWAWELKHS